MNETMVTVIGNIASDVTCRRVGEGEHRLVSFRVASSERRWDKASESWIDGDRVSALVNCWRRLAEGAVVSLVKGDPVIVTGRLSVREYEVDGARRYSTEITATSVGPDLGRCQAEITRRRLTVVDGSGVAAEEREPGDAASQAEAGTTQVDELAVNARPLTDVSGLEVVPVDQTSSDHGEEAASVEEATTATETSPAGSRRRSATLSASA